MNTSTHRKTIKQISILVFITVFVFALFHYSFAQEEISETTTEIVVEENSSEIEPQESEDLEEIQEPEQIEEEKTIVESIIDFFSPEEEELQYIPEYTEEVEDATEEETLQEFPVYVAPGNLPEISAFPELKEFDTDVDASHSCWTKDFVVDMTFLPNKNNVVFIQNPNQGISTMEITGVPEGFDIFFQKNKSQSINLLAGQKEVSIVIEKNGKPQNGNFNVVFVFTRKMVENSTTTCQMNLVNE